MSRFEGELVDAADVAREPSRSAAAVGADIDSGGHRGDGDGAALSTLERPPVDVEVDTVDARSRHLLLGRVSTGLANAAGELGGLFALSLDVAATMVRTRIAASASESSSSAARPFSCAWLARSAARNDGQVAHSRRCVSTAAASASARSCST